MMSIAESLKDVQVLILLGRAQDLMDAGLAPETAFQEVAGAPSTTLSAQQTADFVEYGMSLVNR
jgi:hypothetical protein